MFKKPQKPKVSAPKIKLTETTGSGQEEGSEATATTVTTVTRSDEPLSTTAQSD